MHRLAVFSLLSLALACTEPEVPRPPILPEVPSGAEAVSFRGDALPPLQIGEETRRLMTAQLDSARSAYGSAPGDADAIIWLGRRTAYLGHYRDAVEIFTEGIEKHPEDARMYRHRGHRYISIRDLDRAVADFEQAAALVEGVEDQIEPDGQPNAAGIPTSTLQSNIWYHLGLARYLAGDFDGALAAYEACQRVSTNNDMRIATTYWHYLTLLKLGRDAEAAALLETVTPDLELLENHTYHRILLMFKGALTESDVLNTSGDEDVPLSNATVGYGVGMWHAAQGHEATAREVWERTLAGAQWAAFGYIASEAEMAR